MTLHRYLDHRYLWPLYWRYAFRQLWGYRRYCIRDWLLGVG
jgi:hypothetical protein